MKRIHIEIEGNRTKVGQDSPDVLLWSALFVRASVRSSRSHTYAKIFLIFTPLFYWMMKFDYPDGL